MGGLDGVLDTYGLAAVFVALLTKSIGAPVPVPADALMLWTSSRVAEGRVGIGAAFVTLLVALVAGGVVQFWLARGPARAFLYRYGGRIGLSVERLERAAATIRRGGALGITVAIVTPGARAVTVAAAGIANVPLRIFLPGLLLGSSVFLGLHFALGYAVGLLLAGPLRDVPPFWLVGAAVTLLVVGLVGWIALRRRQLPSAQSRQVVREAVAAWHEAACPACLVLGSAERQLAKIGERGGRVAASLEPIS